MKSQWFATRPTVERMRNFFGDLLCECKSLDFVRVPVTTPDATMQISGERADQRHQFGPRHHPVHLVQELALARSLGRQVQAQISLLHGSRRRSSHASGEAQIGPSYADLP